MMVPRQHAYQLMDQTVFSNKKKLPTGFLVTEEISQRSVAPVGREIISLVLAVTCLDCGPGDVWRCTAGSAWGLRGYDLSKKFSR